MSKIICDVCGTSYPETATQCPICGCVRPADVNTVHIDTDESVARPNGTYTYVKGGRFSKANVKKRNQGKPIANSDPMPKAEKTVEEDNKKQNKGFFIAVAVLIVAIIAVAIFIAVRFLAPGQPDNIATTDTTISATETTVDENTSATVPCEKIAISKSSVTFEHAGAAIFLNITTTPADTTDELQFVSGNDSVATVDDEGRVTAVGSGSTTITVVCGAAKAECQIICNFGDEATEPSSVPAESTEATEPTTQPITGDSQIKLNRDDFTLTGKGATWKLYDGDIPADQITWTSDDEKVATIKDGVVTAVGGGYTTVYAEYQGKKVSCIVRCDAPIASEDDIPTAQGAYKLNTEDRENDVTLKIGETFVLNLLDANNNSVDVVWQVSDANVCSADGNTITALAGGIANVSVTIDDVTYTCIVRVRG